MKTFLFYDIETSGLNPAFDQVLTFAGIRTDLKLNEIDRQTITVRLRKDIVPSPSAFLTHGLTPDELRCGIVEYEAAKQIHKLVNTPNTISIGYNSLGFDDDFLRFMFYRNLLDPYLHQYGNGCSRMDVLPITVIYKVFHPKSLNWPQIDGKPSLKLELIAQENKFETTGRAHEAMNDVEAVIGLSRKLYQKRDIWRYCLDFFNKKRDDVRINSIKDDFVIQNNRFRICLIVSTSFGSKVNFIAPAIHIGQSLSYKNQSLWLRLDADDILGLDADIGLDETFVIRKRAGDATIVLPPLERFWNKMPESSQHSARENMAKIRHHSKRFLEFIQYHLEFKYPFIPDLDPDSGLYQDGFFSGKEKKQGELFHKRMADRQSAHQRIESLNFIKSERIKILASRILARNFDEDLEQAKTSEFNLYMNRLRSPLEEDQIIGYRNDIKYNRQQGLKELKEIEADLLKPNQEQKKMLGWLKDYIETL